MPDKYFPKKISGVKADDSKVSVIGRIVQVSNSAFALQDETGRVEILSEEKVEKDKLVRVFCSVVGGSLRADAVQSLDGFDLNLYNKVKELYEKAGL